MIKMVKVYEKQDHQDWSGIFERRTFRNGVAPDTMGSNSYTKAENEVFEKEKDNRHAFPGLKWVSRKHEGNFYLHTFHFDDETNAMDFMDYVKNSDVNAEQNRIIDQKGEEGLIPVYKISVLFVYDDGRVKQMGNSVHGQTILNRMIPVDGMRILPSQEVNEAVSFAGIYGGTASELGTTGNTQ